MDVDPNPKRRAHRARQAGVADTGGNAVFLAVQLERNMMDFTNTGDMKVFRLGSLVRRFTNLFNLT